MIYLKTDDGISGPIPIERWTQLEFGGKLPRNAQRADSKDGPWSPVYHCLTSEEIAATLEAERTAKEQRKRDAEEQRQHEARESQRNKINSRASMLASLWAFPSLAGSLFLLTYNPLIGVPCAVFSLLVAWFVYNAARAAAVTASKLDE